MARGLALLLIFSLLVVGLPGGIFIRGIKAESTAENRTLADFPSFSIASFISTKYQTDLEQALSDQLIGGRSLKNVYNKIKNANIRLTVAGLKYVRKGWNKALAEPEATNPFAVTLTPRGTELMELDDSHHLVYHYYPLEYADVYLQKKADNINRLAAKYADIEFCCFYIETDADVDFINKKNNHELPNSLQGCLDSRIKFDKLAVNTLSDYQKRFYKTDHHWNSTGQYEGYQGIIALLKGSGEKLYATQTVYCDGLRLYGCKSRQLDDYAIYDDFALLRGAIPDHAVYINNQPGTYGQKQAYENGDYSTEPGVNHYGVCNGEDFGLVEYRFMQPEKGNIVIFADSYSNPINSLIAAHYDNTYIVDLRHYEDDLGQPFDFGGFIRGKNISQVLFSGYAYFYSGEAFSVGD